MMHESQMTSTLKHRAYLEKNPLFIVKEGNHPLETSRLSGVIVSQTAISWTNALSGNTVQQFAKQSKSNLLRQLNKIKLLPGVNQPKLK